MDSDDSESFEILGSSPLNSPFIDKDEDCCFSFDSCYRHGSEANISVVGDKVNESEDASDKLDVTDVQNVRNPFHINVGQAHADHIISSASSIKSLPSSSGSTKSSIRSAEIANEDALVASFILDEIVAEVGQTDDHIMSTASTTKSLSSTNGSTQFSIHSTNIEDDSCLVASFVLDEIVADVGEAADHIISTVSSTKSLPSCDSSTKSPIPFAKIANDDVLVTSFILDEIVDDVGHAVDTKSSASSTKSLLSIDGSLKSSIDSVEIANYEIVADMAQAADIVVSTASSTKSLTSIDGNTKSSIRTAEIVNDDTLVANFVLYEIVDGVGQAADHIISTVSSTASLPSSDGSTKYSIHSAEIADDDSIVASFILGEAVADMGQAGDHILTASCSKSLLRSGGSTTKFSIRSTEIANDEIVADVAQAADHIVSTASSTKSLPSSDDSTTSPNPSAKTADDDTLVASFVRDETVADVAQAADHILSTASSTKSLPSSDDSTKSPIPSAKLADDDTLVASFIRNETVADVTQAADRILSTASSTKNLPSSDGSTKSLVSKASAQPELQSIQQFAEETAKLMGFMSEYKDLKDNLAMVNGTIKDYCLQTQKYRDELSSMDKSYQKTIHELQLEIATLRNKNNELKDTFKLTTKAYQTGDEVRQQDRAVIMESISAKTALINKMRVDLDEIVQTQLASNEQVSNLINDKNNQPDYVESIEYQRTIKDFEQQHSRMLEANMKIVDVQQQFKDEIISVKANLTTAVEDINLASADVKLLKERDMEHFTANEKCKMNIKKMQEEISLLRQQVEIFSNDFEIERKLRQRRATEKELLLRELRSVQERNQKLIMAERKRLASQNEVNNTMSVVSVTVNAADTRLSATTGTLPKMHHRHTGKQTAAAACAACRPHQPKSVSQLSQCPICFKTVNSLKNLPSHVTFCLDKK